MARYLRFGEQRAGKLPNPNSIERTKIQNPFHRVTEASSGERIDVNFNHVMGINETSEGHGGLRFVDGSQLVVKESTRTLRGYTRKTWPAADKTEAAE